MVYQGHDRAKVTDWLPLQGEHAGLQLFILIDDAANTSLGSQLEDIRQFINAQPSTTAIGVAYMRNSIADILQNPTNDHAQAAKALPDYVGRSQPRRRSHCPPGRDKVGLLKSSLKAERKVAGVC